MFIGSTTPPACWHLNKTTDNEFQREVVEALRSYVATITYPIVFGGYGSIRVGASEAQVWEVAPRGAAEENFNYCLLVGVPETFDGTYSVGYRVDTRDDVLLGVDPAPTAQTVNGLRVGATAAQVFEAYRGNEFEWVLGVQGRRGSCWSTHPVSRSPSSASPLTGRRQPRPLRRSRSRRASWRERAGSRRGLSCVPADRARSPHRRRLSSGQGGTSGY